ncbi:hypothetical protein [Romboutsia lituseburensis]|uniref:hypothetical protein n=1 Tax=Romboutsia lituseburensis TaxID=1537 RepID=UPI00215A132F|nr:hypothetical protein [Romboutsia lituseburensis]MCR8744351.1 hypothetical protein [Romboutsia lituseburensis]
MNIKKDYIEKTKKYLEDLRMKLTRKENLQIEIEMLKERQRIEGGMDFNDILRTGTSYRGIEDLIITYDSQITCKQAESERIDHYLRMYELYSRSLSSFDKKILKLRYLESEKKISFVNIAKKLSYSKSAIANIHDEAIEKLAFYIYGDAATYI